MGVCGCRVQCAPGEEGPSLQDWLRADARFPDFLRRDTVSAPFHNFMKSQVIAIETALHLYLKEMGDVKKTF